MTNPMTLGGLRGSRALRCGLRLTVAWVTAAGALTTLPAVSGATILPAWGSNLSATPTLDTSNGDFSDTTTPTQTQNGVAPVTHDGGDLAVWNTSASLGATAPQGGQILQIKVEGCAIEDSRSPTQQSSDGNGGTVPANTINFQTLTASGGTYSVDNTAPYFTLPFCTSTNSSGSRPDLSSGQVNASTVTTYQPIHMCVNKGAYVAFEDVGGFITEGPHGPNYYDQGVPHNVISLARGSAMASFPDAQNQGSYASTGSATSGVQTNPNEELMLQVTEGVGDDAYGLCPGGDANEPANSNTVTCVERHTNPGDPYGTCNGQNRPVYPPSNTSAPTISGTAEQNARLNGSPGTWTNTPYGYSYQWEDCDSSGANCAAIAGTAAKQGYYYPTASDVGHMLVLQVSASNDANTVGPASSAPTAVVSASTLPLPPPPATGPPAITRLSLNPASFNSARGTTIVYNDSQTGTATLRVYALQQGVTHGRSCVPPSKERTKGAKKCKRMVLVKTFTHADRGGYNGVKLSGVQPGSYVLLITTKSAANRKTSRSVSMDFTSRLVKTKHTKKHSTRHR